MSSRETYGVEMQKNPIISSSAVPMRLVYSTEGTAVYKPVILTSPQNTSITGESGKRKRGRPRKYAPDGSMVLAVMPVSPVVVPASTCGMPFSPAVVLPSSGEMSVSPAVVASSSGSRGGFPSVTSSPLSSVKKGRGCPLGSGNKQQMATFGSSEVGITPYVITVKAGEDVSSKIMSFSNYGPWAICILSANGAVSNVTLGQASTSGGTVTYEGRFEILSLSGSFLLSESGGQRSWTGGLSVSLAGPDGRVLGGGVAGLLTAASPVQVVIGSFIVDGGQKEPKSANLSDPSAPPKATHIGAAGTSYPPSRGTLSESSDGPGSPANQSTGACNNSSHQGTVPMPWK